MEYKLGAIGFGNMGSAIIGGAVGAGIVSPAQVAVFDSSPEKQRECSEKGICLLSSAAEVFESCDTVLFAVKPQGMEALLTELSACKKPYPLVICIVAGYRSDKIRARLPGVKIIRVMPNTPLLLGCGATALAACDGASVAQLAAVQRIFAALGETAVITEAQMNDIIPINGSSPAFIYYYIEALARWGEAQGLDYPDALRLCAKTFEGSAKMILEGRDTPAELIRKVCSPGGTTLAAMKVLEEQNAADALQKAASACAARAEELGKM